MTNYLNKGRTVIDGDIEFLDFGYQQLEFMASAVARPDDRSDGRRKHFIGWSYGSGAKNELRFPKSAAAGGNSVAVGIAHEPNKRCLRKSAAAQRHFSILSKVGREACGALFQIEIWFLGEHL